MAFLENLQQLCPKLSSEQASDLRELFVASYKLEPDMLTSTTLQSWFAESANQGYNPETLQETLNQIASAIL